MGCRIVWMDRAGKVMRGRCGLFIGNDRLSWKGGGRLICTDERWYCCIEVGW